MRVAFSLFGLMALPCLAQGPPAPSADVAFEKIRLVNFRFVPMTNVATPGAPRLSRESQAILRSLTQDTNCQAWLGTITVDASETFATAVVTQPVGEAELEATRLAISETFLRLGHINSGALLPDQEVTDGTVTFQVVEGQLSDVQVFGARHHRPDRIRQRLLRRVGRPLRWEELEAASDDLRRDFDLTRIEVDLRPSLQDGQPVPGASTLDLRVFESSPYHLSLQADNHRPPSVGAEQLTLATAHENLTHHGDLLQIHYGLAQRSQTGGVEFSGIDNAGVAYSVPVTVFDTRIGASFDRRDYAIIEEPFRDLSIESLYWGWGLRVDQPILRDRGQRFAGSLAFERRHSEGSLLGQPFSFSPGSVDGRTDISVLRFGASWSRSWTNQILALDLISSVGVDAWEASVATHGPDGRFFSLLARAQYVREVGRRWIHGADDAVQLTLRSTLQWADRDLLAMEQISFGGADTVRGYRENLVVRDAGVLMGSELSIPCIRSRATFDLTLAPFAELATGWNLDAPTPNPDYLVSVGLGLRAKVYDRVLVRLDWGLPLTARGERGNDLQDLGLHFSIGYRVF